MKLLNFGKIKKAWNNIKKFFAVKSKTKTTKTIIEPTKNFGHSNKHRGGWEKYNYKLIPVNKKNKPIIYRDFKKQKLPNSKIIIGKCLYNIVTN